MSFSRGLVIGKFLPLHRGHELLIETAIAQCEMVTVIVCSKATDPVPGELRETWLRELYPQADVLRIDDIYDPDDSQVWANNVIRWLGRAPDAVFSSETYGDRFAHYLGCSHVMVDLQRSSIPCSGTMVRDDPYAAWEYLSPPVRGWYAKRVCIVGAESTGTTTLATSLADHYATSFVPEFGREYWELKWAHGESEWQSSEFLLIAKEQQRLEDATARHADRVVICDTNSLATWMWHRRYMGFDSAELKAIGTAARCDLYVLTGDEIPFVQDGTRDGEHIRHEMHLWFRELLREQSLPWIEVHGTHQQRVTAADAAIRRLFATSKWSLPPLKDRR